MTVMTEIKQFTPFHLFIYGTLTEGFIHFDKIRDFVVQKQAARAKGKVYRLKVGYPVYLEDGLDMVPGSLLTLNHNDLLLSILDEFHGLNPVTPEKSLHFRRQVELETENSAVMAWVYALNPSRLPKDAKLIDGGDWRQSLEQEPALPEKLTERQKSYVRKLGAISGREIVPINDLSLYRELMNLDLIVDKGRRLALSKLGHEVHRYLE